MLLNQILSVLVLCLLLWSVAVPLRFHHWGALICWAQFSCCCPTLGASEVERYRFTRPPPCGFPLSNSALNLSNPVSSLRRSSVYLSRCEL